MVRVDLDKVDVKEIVKIAKMAGKAILEIYNKSGDIKVEYKEHKDEIMPLTEADKKAHSIIVEGLMKESEIPILSEEGELPGYEERKQWDWFWLIDPLDGTKEFIKRRGEFTVNIALIHNGEPVLGVVYVPVKDKMYYAKQGEGAFRQVGDKGEERLQPKAIEGVLRVVASKSHFNEETKKYIDELSKGYEKVELVNAGSSLKLCLVAEGKADVYPRLGPTSEWDTAAAHAIVKEAGKKVLVLGEDRELEYNKENILNPFFIVK